MPGPVPWIHHSRLHYQSVPPDSLVLPVHRQGGYCLSARGGTRLETSPTERLERTDDHHTDHRSEQGPRLRDRPPPDRGGAHRLRRRPRRRVRAEGRRPSSAPASSNRRHRRRLRQAAAESIARPPAASTFWSTTPGSPARPSRSPRSPDRRHADHLDTNVFGVVRVTHAFLPLLEPPTPLSWSTSAAASPRWR